jgi:hypothetical protein
MHVGFNNATQGQAFTIKDGLNAIDVALWVNHNGFAAGGIADEV